MRRGKCFRLCALGHVKHSSHVAKMHSAMALAATNGTPRIHVDDGQLLGPAGCEGIVEVVSETGRLVPGVLGIPKEHAQQVTGTRLPIGSLVCFASMHDAQIVDELYVALLPIEPCTEPFREVLNYMHGVHLLVRGLRHAWVPLDTRASEERRLDKLAYGLAS